MELVYASVDRSKIFRNRFLAFFIEFDEISRVLKVFSSIDLGRRGFYDHFGHLSKKKR